MAAVTTSGAVAQLGRALESHWRGFYERGDPVGERECLLIKDPIRFGWGKENPSFRQLFTARFIPEGTVEQVAWFNELCRRTTTGEIAAELLSLRARMNVGDFLERVRVPTLVMHTREDNVTPLAEGGLVASLIPDRNSSSSTRRTTSCRRTSRLRFKEAVLEFVGQRSNSSEHDRFASLSRREREILALITEGLGNAEISKRLSISEKTVRSHISSVYDKLGVGTRAQALVFARDHGFRL